MSVDQTLSGEIDAAVESVSQELQAERETVAGNEPEANESADEPKNEETSDEVGDDPGSDSEGGGLDHSGGESGESGSERGDERGEEDSRGEGGEAEGSGQETPVKPEAPKGPSDEVLSRAVLAGIPLAEARQFASDDSLLRVVGAIHDAAGTGDEPDGKAGEEAEEKDPFADLPELDPEEYDPKLIKTFEAMKSALKSQNETIKGFRQQQEESAQAANEAAARDVEQWFDKQVESLGEEFTEALGEGAMSALDRGSSQYAKRDEIASRMAIILAGYQATGQQAPPREDVFNEAARLVLHDQFVSARERKLAKDLESRAGQHIARPGGKKTKQTQSPFDEAAAELDRKYFGN